MKHTIAPLALAILLAATFSLTAQNAQVKTPNWTSQAYAGKVFIQNKGQFDQLPVQGKILYGTETGDRFFFTSSGVTCALYKVDKMTRSEKEQLEKKTGTKREKDADEMDRKIVRKSYVRMQWLDANASPEIVVEDAAKDYWNYRDPKNPGKSIDRIPGYKKLTYKNLYPNIDVVYVCHPKGGIKYSLILHPGADLSKVKMQYTGANKIEKDGEGNIIITAPNGEVMTDHAPDSYYENGSKVSSSFSISDNVVSFETGAYDHRQTLVVDPWTNTTFTPVLTPVEIGRDAANNVYIFGHFGPQNFSPITMYVQKFDASGALQWTFNVPGADPNYDCLTGDLAVDPQGNSYVTDGLSFTIIDCQMMKISTTGSMVWNSVPSPNLYENWRAIFNCDYTQLIQTGCSPGCCNGGSGDIMNTTTGTESGLFVPPNNGDMVCSHFGQNGKLYSISVQDNNTFQTHVTCLDPATSFSTVFSIPCSFSIPDGGQQSYGPLGFNGIFAGCAFLYDHEGTTLEKRDLNTGNILGTVAIPGGGFRTNSGTAVDKCGNVYVGSTTGVYIFDANLVQIAFFPTPYFVTDICIGTGGTFYACGGDATQNTGFLSQMNQTACPSPVTVTTTPTSCNNNNSGTATATANFCSGPYTYSWSNGQTTSTATGLSSGTYTCVVSGAGACNETDTVTAIIAGGLTVASATQTNASCFGSTDGTASAGNVTGGTGPYTYTWSTNPQQTGTNATGLGAGTYTLTVTDSQGCQGIVTVTITQPTQVGGTNTTTSAGCNSSTGTATCTGTGGTGPYTYSWATSPSQTGATATGLSTGIYTVFVTDANGCTGTDTAIVNSSNGPQASIQSSVNPLCNGGQTGTATATATGGTQPYTYSWVITPSQSTQTATGLGAGTYTVVVTDANGCSSIVTVTLSQPTPVGGTTVQTNVQCFGGNNGSSTATGSGGTGPYSYVWNTTPAQSGATANGLTAGTYTVTITDANGCTNTVPVTITQPPSPADTLAITGNFCPGDSAAMLYAPSGFSSYSWYFNNVYVSGANDDSLFITNTGSYTGYTVTWMLNGCVRTTSLISLTSPSVVFTPDSLSNVFTPNNDGKNDFFTPYSGKLPSAQFIEYYAKDYDIKIYNRWGNLVFETTDIKTQWDGKMNNGKEASAGTYYWISSYVSRCDPAAGQVINKGFVQILR